MAGWDWIGVRWDQCDGTTGLTFTGQESGRVWMGLGSGSGSDLDWTLRPYSWSVVMVREKQETSHDERHKRRQTRQKIQAPPKRKKELF